MRILKAFLLLVVALILQFFFGEATGVWISFVLAALITLSFFVSFVELALLVLLAVLVLNWQPAVSLEIVVFALLPIAAFLLRGSLPWQPWLTSSFFIFLGLFALYVVFGLKTLIVNPNTFSVDILASLLFGVLVFHVMDKSAPK